MMCEWAWCCTRVCKTYQQPWRGLQLPVYWHHSFQWTLVICIALKDGCESGYVMMLFAHISFFVLLFCKHWFGMLSWSPWPSCVLCWTLPTLPLLPHAGWFQPSIVVCCHLCMITMLLAMQCVMLSPSQGIVATLKTMLIEVGNMIGYKLSNSTLLWFSRWIGLDGAWIWCTAASE